MSLEKPNIYNKNEMIKKLAENGFFISLSTLNSYIQKLRIDAIYENANGVELFDELAYERISVALSQRNAQNGEAGGEEEVEDVEVETKNLLELPQQVLEQKLTGENAFKLDISENTLNMIARTIARKIAKQVNTIFANEDEKSKKLAHYEEKNLKLYAQLGESEKENQKLRVLLREANQNLNLYKPTIFGLYKFAGKKRRK